MWGNLDVGNASSDLDIGGHAPRMFLHRRSSLTSFLRFAFSRDYDPSSALPVTVLPACHGFNIRSFSQPFRAVFLASRSIQALSELRWAGARAIKIFRCRILTKLIAMCRCYAPSNQAEVGPFRGADPWGVEFGLINPYVRLLLSDVSYRGSLPELQYTSSC